MDTNDRYYDSAGLTLGNRTRERKLFAGKTFGPAFFHSGSALKHAETIFMEKKEKLLFQENFGNRAE